MNVGVGVRFFHTSTYEDASTNKVYPWTEAEYAPTSWLKVHGRYNPRVLRTSLLDLYTRIPPVALEADVLPKEDELRGEGGMEIGGDRVNLRLLVCIERGETLIWREVQTESEGIGLWQLDANDHAEIRSVRATCSVTPAAQVGLSGWGTIRDATREGTDEDVPYVPEAEAGADLELAPGAGFRATVSLRWVGERPTGGTGTELDPYGTLDVRLSKAFGDHVTVFVRGTNLLEDEYEVWPGYVEPGRGIYGGLEAKW